MIQILTSADWPTLRSNGLVTVLDPLTFRAAETFLRGAPEQGDEDLWAALSKSVDALATFVDAVIRIIADEIQRRTKGDAAVSLHLSYAADWKALAGALTGTRWDCSPGSTPAPPWTTALCDSGPPRSFPGVGSVGS